MWSVSWRFPKLIGNNGQEYTSNQYAEQPEVIADLLLQRGKVLWAAPSQDTRFTIPILRVIQLYIHSEWVDSGYAERLFNPCSHHLKYIEVILPVLPLSATVQE